jgi:hypothetical protein
MNHAHDRRRPSARPASTGDDVVHAALIARASFDAHQLAERHPPRFTNSNKKLIHSMACPPDCRHEGPIAVSRWAPVALPAAVPALHTAHAEYEAREGVYDYAPAPRLAGAARPLVEWHALFTTSRQFVNTNGPGFAQDEIVLAEHPAFAALRETLARTTDPAVEPFAREVQGSTTLLVRGVERRCAVNVARDPSAGRPYGLYGANFLRASPAGVRAATRVLAPPPRSNLVEIELPIAPPRSYTLEAVTAAATAVYTGFLAARAEATETATARRGPPRVVVHTRHWCEGSFGDDPVATALLQVLVARLARIDRLVYHAVEPHELEACRRAFGLWEHRLAPGVASGAGGVTAVLRAVCAMLSG